jgi:hypothetical protein
MTLVNIILFVSMLVWAIPPFKQRKTKYFSYFLLLAVCDPLTFIVGYLFRIQYNFLNMMFLFFFIASLIEKKIIQKLMLALSLLFPVAVYVNRTPPVFSLYLSTFVHIIMVLIVVTQIMFHLKQRGYLNLFLCMLMFYMLISVTMRMTLIANLKIGTVSYYLGGAFQILFGIAFMLINVNTKNYKLVEEKSRQAE